MNAIALTQILLLENEGLVRAGMKSLIQIAEPQALVYEAACYEQAITIFSTVTIDIAFLDFNLSGEQERTGLDVLHYLRQQEICTHAVMLSAYTDKELVMSCLAAGACGYISKGMDDNGVFRHALDTVLQGGVFLPVSLFDSNSLPSKAVSAQVLGIKGRMADVLYYLCQGCLNKTIADKLGIAEGTVRKDYVSKLLRHFKVTNRTQLLVEVARQGILLSKPAGLPFLDKAG